MGLPLSRGRERLESFLRQSGMACLRPLKPPPTGHTLRLETSQDFRAWNERASRCGLSLRCSETRSRSLCPLIRVCCDARRHVCTNFGFQPRRICDPPQARRSSTNPIIRLTVDSLNITSVIWPQKKNRVIPTWKKS